MSIAKGERIARGLYVPPERKLFSLTEAATILGISRWTAYRWVQNGTLTGRRVSGRTRVLAASVNVIVEGTK